MAIFTPKQLAETLGVSERGIGKYAERSGFKKAAGRWEFSEDETRQIVEHFSKTPENELNELGIVNESEPPAPNEQPLNDNEQLEQVEKNTNEQSELIEQLKNENERLVKLLDESANRESTLLKTIENLTETNRMLSADTTMKTATEKKELLLATNEADQPKKDLNKEEYTFGQRLKFLFTGFIED